MEGLCQVEAAAPRAVDRPRSFIFTLSATWSNALLLGRAVAGIGRADSAHGALRGLGGGRSARPSRGCLAKAGWSPANEGNRAFYAVTERGRRRIEDLSPRIYGPVVEWDGRWRMLDLHDRRSQPRAAGSPAQRTGRARMGAALGFDLDFARRRVDGRAGSGRGRRCASVRCISSPASIAARCTDRELLETCWDIEAIASQYRDFSAVTSRASRSSAQPER